MTDERSEPTRGPHVRLYLLAKSVVTGLFKHHAFDHAATMSFYFFLGSIPLLVIGGLLIGAIVQRAGAEELAAPLYRAMPGAAADLFRQELRDIATEHATSIAPLSLLGFVWLTTNGVHNLMDVFELLIGASPRSWWRQRLIAVACVAGMLVTGVLVTWILLVGNGIAMGADSAAHLPSLLGRASDYLAAGWRRIGVLSVFVVISSGALAIFYRVAVVHPHTVRRHVWPGTIVAMLLWALVSWAFSAYVRTIGHYAVYYGSLATVAVVLLWLYLTSLALVVGAEINAQLEGVRG